MGKAKAAKSKTVESYVVIESKELVYKRPTVQRIIVGIKSDGPMLMHRFPESTMRGFMNKADGISEVDTAAKKTIAKQFEESKYVIAETKDKKKPILGFPASGFKGALIAATRQHGDKKVNGAIVKQAVFIVTDPSVHNELVPFTTYESCTERIDRICTNTRGSKNSNISVRAEVKGWKAELVIQFDPNSLNAQQILQLLNIAGNSVGIGAWRPTSNGTFGRFTVDDEVPAMLQIISA